MIQYPDCPFCTNLNSGLSIVDVEISGVRLKGIQCNACKRYIGYYQDNNELFTELSEKISDMESSISDLEG